MTYSPPNTLTAYLATTEVFPSDEEELLVKLTSNYTNIANAMNLRVIGQYDTVEVLTGEQFFNTTNPQKKRQSFRTVYSIGAIAAGATLTTAHGLTNVTAYTHIYGTAITAVPDNRPIPYASATAVNLQIEINVTAVNIVIINGAAAPNITSAIVVLEYLKT